TEQMCVVGLPVDSGMPNGCATADVARGVINKAFAVPTRMMPDHAASTGIESVSIVGGSRKHYAVHNHRCNFQAVLVCGVKDPLGSQLSDVSRVDLGQAAVAAPGVIAIVG